MVVGFIGLGNMGAHMARNLIKHGNKLLVFDVNASAMEQLKSDGADVATSPADLAAASKVIITMLPSSPHVKEVYGGDKGIFRKIRNGTLCIDSSTIDPETSISMAQSAVGKQCVYLDAPVSGGILAARDAALTFMVGGELSAFKKAEPFLKQMGKNIVHCGNSGTGQAAKICNNMLLAICMIGTSEAMNLGQRLGLDSKLLAQIINTSSGRCWSSELYNPVPGVLPNVPSSRDYEGGFASVLMCKDLGLAMTAAASCQAPTPLGAAALHLYRLSCQSGLDKKDFSSVYQFLKGRST